MTDHTGTDAGTEVRPLSSRAVLALAWVIHAAEREAPVRRLTGDGDVIEGVARRLVISPDNSAFPGRGHDVRDCYLRVSGTFERFWPVAELVEQFGTGELVFD